MGGRIQIVVTYVDLEDIRLKMHQITGHTLTEVLRKEATWAALNDEDIAVKRIAIMLANGERIQLL